MRAILARHVTPTRFDVNGVTAIDFQKVVSLLEPLAGKDVTVADLIQRADAITQLYRDAGYLLSFALLQSQDFKDGVVKVTVVEGYVGSTRIEGDPKNAAGKIRDYARRIEAERPLTQPTLERYLNLIATVAGATVKPGLNLPTRADGATELVLDVGQKPLRFDAGIGNLGTGTHAMLTATASSLSPLGEQLQVTTAVPRGGDRLEYYAANASVPIGSSGLSAKVDAYDYAASPNSNILSAQGLDRRVHNQHVGASISYPFILANQRSLTGTAGIYANWGSDRYTNRANGASAAIINQTRVMRAELAYAEATPLQTRRLTGAVYKGMGGLGASQNAYSNVDLDFTRYTLAATQSLTLPYRFGVTVNALGQYSGDSLPTSEQITFGGLRFGAGYPAGEVGGDKGWGASIELNRSFPTGWRYVPTVQPYFLADTARVSLNNRAYSLVTDHLSSLALGLRITDAVHYALDINVAKPVGDKPTESDSRPLRLNANYSFRFE